MAAPVLNDRKQAARVRKLLMDEIERYFSTDPLKLSETEQTTKRELLLRMAANTLPRLNEHTGEDGDPIKYTLVSYADSTAPVPTPALPEAVIPV